MTEESQQTPDEEQEQEDTGSEGGPPVTEGGGTWDPGESDGHEGSAGQEPGDPGREA